MTLASEIRSKYVAAHRASVKVEAVDSDSVLVSLPLHFSAYTRVEFAVTRIDEDQFVISDLAQTIGELKDAGYGVGGALRERMGAITKMWKVQISGNTLVRTCSAKELGTAVQEFAEAAKTIGDAYLAYPTRGGYKDEGEDEHVRQRIRRTFQAKRLCFEEGRLVPGRIESHKVDFYIQPNGSKGLALAILPQLDLLHAEAWGFRSQDIKNADDRMLVGIVYDIRIVKPKSLTIIEKMADISLPSTQLDSLEEQLESKGIWSYAA